MKKYKLLFTLILIIAGTAISFYFINKKTQDKYNLVVFDPDVFRADGLDCENHPEITPNLCEVKDEFIKFDNHHAQTDMTKPGMASFLTSSYPTTHGVWNEFFSLSEEQPELVGILKNNGYHTLIVGDITNPQVISNNYDEKIDDNFHELEISHLVKNKPFFKFIYYGNLHYPYLYANEITNITHPDKPEGFPQNIVEFNEDANKIIALEYPEIYEKPAIKEFIKKQNGSTAEVYKYFLNICWGENLESKLVNFDACWEVAKKTFEQYLDKNNPNQIEFVKYLYQERIREVDSEIGLEISNLKSNDLWDKTVFIIRSDHGEEFMEHGRMNHWNNLYQELVRVPFWIHVPGQKGRTVDSLTQTIDEAPTLLSALGIKPHSFMQGRDLLDPANYESSHNFTIAQKLTGLVFSIIDGEYKLISIDDNSSDEIYYELYNLKDDPGEENNIANDNQEIKGRLLFEYYSAISRQPRFEPSAEFFEKLNDQQKMNMYQNGYF